MANNSSEGSSMLVGVSLLSDGAGEPVSNLGLVVVSAKNSSSLTLTKLRQLIKDQIPLCPQNFRFYLQGRWPISASQESSVLLKNLVSTDGSISIQQVHNKPKVGIRSKTGIGLGFVFAELSITLTELRSQLKRELPTFTGVQDNYHYLDANGWPVTRQLERSTILLEVLTSSCVTVESDSLMLRSRSHEAIDEADGNWSVCSDQEPPRKKLKGMRHLSFSSSKDLDREASLHSTPPQNCPAVQAAIAEAGDTGERKKKQLLISYVRAEAADYALHLKLKLAEHGYSVYLDVHEISVGVDWQDSLNFAVSNCEVFIPLVTPRYGETLWTNREVKLADVLGKYILPVNFLPEWPPRCLAIQFATTQFVVCSRSFTPAITNGNADKCKQMAQWDLNDVAAAAEEISKKLKRLSKAQAAVPSAPSLTRMKTLRKTFVGRLPAMSKINSGSDIDLPSSKTKLIVVCLHPKQAEFGQELKSWLQGRSCVSFSVWLSCETEFVSRTADTQPVLHSQNSQRSPPHGQDGAGDYCTVFQDVADKAAAVLVVLSKDFAESQTCKQQMFYCEQRKPVVPIHLEEFSMPGWLNMLLRTSCSEGVYQHNYRQNLLARLDRILNAAAPENQEQCRHEALVCHAVDQIKRSVPTDSCVYIAGSTSFRNKKSQDICKAIGIHLARLEGVSVATGGFYGIGETVSRAFYEECQRLKQKREVWHILPDRDVKDFTQRASQNPDGTFAVAAFGKTLFFGDSVRQRESIVGRCFEICILIEGGPGAAHEAEEFVWNDRLVIPLSCTGGAASGSFSVPEKMFERPRGVSEEDWLALKSQDLSADEIGQCVARIVSGILQNLAVTRRRNREISPAPSAQSSSDMDTTPPIGSLPGISSLDIIQSGSTVGNRETMIFRKESQ